MTINSEQLSFILDNTPPEQNIMLVGKHGIGKSRILEDYFSSKNSKVVTLFLGQMSDPGDLIGLPEKNEKTGKTDFMLPYWFPIDGEPIVLFLDELNRARPEVLQTIMDLTLNRKLAGKTLPKGSRIISAVNNGNEYQLTDLDPALVSRFNIYEFAPTVNDWLLWAEKSNLDQRIINFISENPEYLDGDESATESSSLERSPDRRSWERCSNITKKFEQLTDLHKPIVSGILGARVTSLFFKFVNENNIPSAKEILSEDFSVTKEKIKNIAPVEFSQINNSIFNFLESKNYNPEKENLICENLEKYFDYILQRKELANHFISLISAKTYPETLFFISTKCKSLYKKIFEAL